MNDIETKIIELIKKNKISTVEVSDALGKSGALIDILPLNYGHFCVGKVEYICTFHGSNWELHNQFQNISENKIVYIDSLSCGNRALFGDIVSKYALLYRNSIALVVNGKVRDIHMLKKSNYPIFSKGITPIGCFNKETRLEENDIKYMQKQKEIFQDAIIVCDDSGVVLIQKENFTKQFYNQLQHIELQEDIWYFCTDTLKMNTFETICEKKYLDDKEFLISKLNRQIDELQNDK